MSQSIEQLRKLTDEEAIALHDSIATNTVVGVQFYLDEINRREQNKQTDLMVKFTKQILWLTVFIAVLTVINVIAVIVPFSAIRSMSFLSFSKANPSFKRDCYAAP